MTTNKQYLARLRRKLDILRLDAKAVGKQQLTHDLRECLTIVDRLEKLNDRADKQDT